MGETITIRGRATRHEYIPRADSRGGLRIIDGKPPDIKCLGRDANGRLRWRANLFATDAAAFFRRMQQRRREREDTSVEARKRQMAREFAKRAARSQSAPKPATPPQPRGPVLFDSCGGKIF